MSGPRSKWGDRMEWALAILGIVGWCVFVIFGGLPGADR